MTITDTFTSVRSTKLNRAQVPIAWIWDGYLAPGRVTLLTSQWKSGKSTLLSVLLSKRARVAEPATTLAGLKVATGRTAVVSEEDTDLWQERNARLDFGPDVWFLCRPFTAKPSEAQWLALLEHLALEHQEHGLDLIVFDSLAAFLPGHAECNAVLLLDALMPLFRLTKLGVAILLLHHPRKGSVLEGQVARGTGALAALVDISLEMSYVGQPSADDRRRHLAGFSRFPATPRQLLLEWNQAGDDYTCLAHDFADGDFLVNRQHLLNVLEDAKDKLTRQQILAEWPADFLRPSESTLWRWLDRAVEQGMIAQEGTGRRSAPFTYWLPHKLEQWRQNPLYDFLHEKPPVLPW